MISLKAIWHWFRLLFKDYSGAKKQIEDANALIPDEEVRRAMQLVRDLPDEQREFILDYVGGGLTPELYGSDGCWPVLNKWDHVIAKPLPAVSAGESR